MNDSVRASAVTAVVSVALTYSAVRLFTADADPRVEAGRGVAPVASAGSGVALTPEVERARAELTASREEATKLAEENRTLRADLEGAKRRSNELEARVAALASESAASRAPAAAGPPAAAPGPRLRVQFGKWGDVDELRKADWAELAAAVRVMAPLARDVKVKIEAGEEIKPELGIKLAKENAKLQKLAFAIHGKLPTHSPGNGEYTHPICLANLMAKHLELAGCALDESQVNTITRLGEDYDSRWAALQAGYGPTSLKLEKILDELELKKVFVDKIRALFTPAQRAEICDPAVLDVASLDLYSPMLMILGHAAPLARETREALKKALVEQCAEGWEVPEDRKIALETAADAVLRAVEPNLKAGLARAAGLYTLDEALVAGRAEVAAMKDLARTLEKSDAILETGSFFVPRLVMPKAK